MSVPLDPVLREAMARKNGGLDPELTEEALGAMQRAVARQMEALAASKYRRRKVEARCPVCRARATFTLPAADPEVLARAAAATAKAADTVARLSEFLAGKPDSRPDVAGAWLRALTDEQLRVVQGWIEANGR